MKLDLSQNFINSVTNKLASANSKASTRKNLSIASSAFRTLGSGSSQNGNPIPQGFNFLSGLLDIVKAFI